MDDKTRKQMAKMVDAVQPHCEEPISAAMTCSQAGTMTATLFSRLLGGSGGNVGSVNLPNPVFIAVGSESIYAFKYAPRGFNFKIKQEVVRWHRDQISIETENSGTMASFVIRTDAGEEYHLEIPTMMGGRKLVDAFFSSLERS
jgi:hypothetical protein